MSLRALVIAVAALTVALASPAPVSGKVKDAPIFDVKGQTPDRFAAPDLFNPEPVYVRAHRDRRGKEIRLFARVYRPNRPLDDPYRPAGEAPYDADWKTPIVLIHSPYNHGGRATNVESWWPQPLPFRPGQITFLVKRGYTVVVSDVRGSSNSGGCFEHGGPDQARDFATLVEHFAAQPWSNGKVGALGASQDGRAVVIGATLAPRGLETIVPIAAWSSEYMLRVYDGVPRSVGTSGYEQWGIMAARGQVPGEDPSGLQAPGRADCEPEGGQAAIDQTGNLTPYLGERDFHSRVQDVRASVLYFQGFDDLIVSATHLVGWYDELPVFRRAVFGQWDHIYPDGPAARGRDDYHDMLHAWFDYWLLGLKTGVKSWPPLQVSDEGTPGAGPPDEDGNATAGVVWRSVDSFAELGVRRGLTLGSDSRLGGTTTPGSFVEGHEVTAAFEWTLPVEERLHLSGQALLDAQITLDKDDAHFAVHLYERRADGEQRLLTLGYLSAPHAESLENPTPREPGRPYKYRIRMIPFDKWVEAGSTVVLGFFGGDGNVVPAGNGYRMKLATDGSSVLHLPVVEEVCGINVLGARQQARPELIPTC